MGSRLANFASWLREVLPEPFDPWFANRWASPMVGGRYRVRTRLPATLVTLPLGRDSRRLPVSLPPTTVIAIHAATRPDEDHVYAVIEGADATELLAPTDRVNLTAGPCLLEIPRRVLDAQCMRL